jgi:hypothetical protein
VSGIDALGREEALRGIENGKPYAAIAAGISAAAERFACGAPAYALAPGAAQVR